jgi:hypothetical protein
MQVVRGVDAFHSAMGGVLLLLHAPGVRILPGTPGEPLPPRHRRPVRLPHRHRRPLLRRLSRHPLLPHGLRPQAHRPSVPLFSYFPTFNSVVAMQNKTGVFMLLDLLGYRYLKSRFFVDLLGCFPWDAIYKVPYIDFHSSVLVFRFFYSIRSPKSNELQ